MSRTARCLVAIGMSVTLAAACGDDDQVVAVGGAAGSGGSHAGTGGTTGKAGSGGAPAGAAGKGGGIGGKATGTGGKSAGGGAGKGGSPAAGAGGEPNIIPDGGTPDASTGTGGTGSGLGGSAGTGGTGGTAGTGSVVVDAGPPDSGLNGNCPNFNTAALAADDGNQAIVISHILFRNVGTPNARAAIFLRAVGGAFDFSNSSYLCNGLGDCTFVGGLGVLAQDSEQPRSLDNLSPDGGEVVLISSDGAFANAYIAWEGGTPYTSATSSDLVSTFTPVAGDPALVITQPDVGSSTLEDFAANATNPAQRRWTAADRVSIPDGANSILEAAGGTAQSAAGYATCTGDGDF